MSSLFAQAVPQPPAVQRSPGQGPTLPIERFTANLNRFLDEVEVAIENSIDLDFTLPMLELALKDASQYRWQRASARVYARLCYCLARGYHLKEGETAGRAVKLYEVAIKLAATGSELYQKYTLSYLDFLVDYPEYNRFGVNGLRAKIMEFKGEFPGNADIHVVSAKFNFNLNQPALAHFELEQAQHKAPNNERLNLGFGVEALKMRDYQKAKAHFQRVVAVNPNSLLTQTMLAVIYHEEKNPAAAAHALKAEALSPYDPDITLLLGGIYLQQHAYRQAAEKLNQAIRRISEYQHEEKLSEIYSNLAVCYFVQYKAGQGAVYLGLTKNALEQAVRLNRNNVSAFYNLACFYSVNGELAQAVQYLREVFSRLKPADVKEYLALYENDEDLNRFRASESARQFETEVLTPLRQEAAMTKKESIPL